jgi:hypothetical protein
LAIETTADLPDPHSHAREPWQTWPTTARYAVTRLVEILPTLLLLLWQVFVRRLTVERRFAAHVSGLAFGLAPALITCRSGAGVYLADLDCQWRDARQ